MNLFTLDNLFLLLIGGLVAYLLFRFWGRYSKEKKLFDVYYMMGFAVLLVSGLLLIFLGLGILASPYVLTVASLIPLGISMGIVEEYFPQWKKAYKWFALIGFLAIAVSAIGGFDTLQEDLRASVSRRGWTGDLPRPIPYQERAERFLVGGHRRAADRSGRNRIGLYIGRCSAAVLQPGVRHDDPHPAAAPDDHRLHHRLCQGHQRLRFNFRDRKVLGRLLILRPARE